MADARLITNLPRRWGVPEQNRRGPWVRSCQNAAGLWSDMDRRASLITLEEDG